MTKKIEIDLDELPSCFKVENKLGKFTIKSNEFIGKDKKISSFYGNLVDNTDLDNAIEVVFYFYFFAFFKNNIFNFDKTNKKS